MKNLTSVAAYSVSSFNSYSGGFVGYTNRNNGNYHEGSVSNCYATGNVSSLKSYSGGFIGYLYFGEISSCYSMGEVLLGNKGAFAGYLGAGSLSQCYYNSDITGSLAGVGNNRGNDKVLGVTTSGMKIKNTFTNWDFTDIWAIEENVTYPYLHNIPNYMGGSERACPNSTHTYSTYTGKSNYTWTITNGSITSGQSTNRITVKWNNNTNVGNVTVTYNGTEKAVKNITLFPLPAPVIVGERNAFTQTEYIYSTEAGKTNYLWTISGGEILSGLETNEIKVQWKEKTGKLSVNYANEGGCMADTSVNTTVWGNNRVGGLVGQNYSSNAKIHQCYAQNTTVGSNQVGGLTGQNFYGATISQSYAAGIVSGGNYVGGLLGYNDRGTITGCYYDEEVSEQYDGLGNPEDSQYNNIKAKYTSEMMKQKTFLAWDFTNVWQIDEIESYPFFQWQGGARKVNIESVGSPGSKIYPNPTGGLVYIECEANVQLRVYTVSGQLLYQVRAQSGRETIDLSSCSKGVYLIKAGNIVQKVIKK